MSLRVNEIFSSIQGEGHYTGVPMTFIRFQGCNLRCPWCDTKHTLDPQGGAEMSVGQILQYVKRRPPKHVCLTGGEPLMQPHTYLRPLIGQLTHYGYMVHLETNGTFPLKLGQQRLAPSWVTVSPKPLAKYVVRINWEWVDEVKIVVEGPQELCILEDLIAKAGENREFDLPLFWVQPVDADLSTARLWSQILTTHSLPNTGLSMQMHKILEIP